MKALEAAAEILSRRAHSVFELTAKLEAKGFDDDEIEQAVTYMAERRYVDDAAYAEGFARARAERGQGAYRIRQELLRRGVDDDTIEEALSALPEPEDAIQTLLRRKLSVRNDEKARRNAAAMLARRGYDYDDIRSALRVWEE